MKAKPDLGPSHVCVQLCNLCTGCAVWFHNNLRWVIDRVDIAAVDGMSPSRPTLTPPHAPPSHTPSRHPASYASLRLELIGMGLQFDSRKNFFQALLTAACWPFSCRGWRIQVVIAECLCQPQCRVSFIPCFFLFSLALALTSLSPFHLDVEVLHLYSCPA